MRPIPILFVGDSPDLPTGLARIGRNLASLVAKLPEFRVGYLGRGGSNTAKLPFYQQPFPATDQWGENHVEKTWNDFAGEEPGVVFTIWDASRLHWFANPVGINGSLGEFLRSGAFRRWGYFPVDSYGVGERLTAMSADTIHHYDRVLAYGAFGARVIENTIKRPVEWIPHGVNSERFQPQSKVAGRMALGIPQDGLVVGCVMTNQGRKDWGMAFATAARLAKNHKKFTFWAHVDTVSRYWDLQALVTDFGLERKTVITTGAMGFTDLQMSFGYSACDVTILPSLGEGFGYPVVESMLCGVGCVTGNYGGSVELIPDAALLVNPVAERLDTLHNCVRPVFSPADWVETIEKVLDDPGLRDPELYKSAVAHLDWKLLWPAAWKKWFLDGIR